MDSDIKPDLRKIIEAGIAILVSWWILVYMVLSISLGDEAIYDSIFILILSIPIYFFLALIVCQ